MCADHVEMPVRAPITNGRLILGHMHGCRGLRLVNTVFLTQAICCLQLYIGIRCSQSLPVSNPIIPGANLPSVVHEVPSGCTTRHGFDFWLCFSVLATLISAAFCYLSMELNDMRAKTDKTHVVEMTVFFIYRMSELAARAMAYGLFAVRFFSSSRDRLMGDHRGSGVWLYRCQCLCRMPVAHSALGKGHK